MLVKKTETLFSGKLNKTSHVIFGIAGPFKVLLDILKMRRFPDVLISKSPIFNGIYKSWANPSGNK